MPGEIFLPTEKKSRTESFGSFQLPLSPLGKVVAQTSLQNENQKSPDKLDVSLKQTLS